MAGAWKIRVSALIVSRRGREQPPQVFDVRKFNLREKVVLRHLREQLIHGQNVAFPLDLKEVGEKKAATVKLSNIKLLQQTGIESENPDK